MIHRWISRVGARIRHVPDIERLRANGLLIGETGYIGRGVVLDPGFCWLIEIGDRCTFSPESMVLAHDASTKRGTGYTRVRRTTIGHRVYVGARAIILPGVDVGDDAIIGAGAIVTRDVPAGAMVAGNPAKVVGSTAAHADKHLRRLEDYPVIKAEEWASPISPERRAKLIDALLEGEGYVS